MPTGMIWSHSPRFRQDEGMNTLSCRGVLAAMATALLTGCAAEKPVDLLADMARAYREATAYSDDARISIRETRGDSTTDRTLPFRVAFRRPDRIRIDAYDARIAADGTELFAAVGTVPGQVLAEPVKSPLALDQLFTDDELRATLAEGEAGCPTQLPLLLADDTLDLIVAEATEPPRVTGDETIEGHACARVEIIKPEGALVLWIDRATKLLRRMRVPTDSYATLLSRQAGSPVGVTVVVDFTTASFTAAVPDDAFRFDVPPEASRVSRLEPLRPPAPMHPLVGKPADFTAFTAADGARVTRESLSGAPAVLEFFFKGCGPSARSMPQVATGIAEFVAEHARAHGGDRPTVRHYAVSLDEAEVPADDLKKKLAEFGGVGTLARDPDAVVAQSLGIDSFPAAVIVAPDGTVADVQQGDHGRLAADVAEVLTVAAAGEPTMRLVRDRFERRAREYRRELDRAAGKGSIERLPEQVIAPRKQPVRFKLERAWRAAGVSLPGNVLCLDASRGAETPTIVALDGWRTVVLLDVTGAETARHELPLPRDAAIGFLRTAVDSSGRRWWLGGSRGGQHVFVFDDDWKLHATYPEPGGAQHDGISAAELADLDGDGTPEIVAGYFGSVGLQAANLDGKRLWRERGVGTVLDVAVGPPAEAGAPRRVFCAAADGRLVIATTEGPVGEPQTQESPVRSIVSGPVAVDATWALLGLATPGVGRQTAVGLDPVSGSRLWELPLADGIHRDGPIEPVAWADLLGTPRRQWLIAAPDGSITVAWADGRVVDRYQHGKPLVGIGGYRHADTGHVVIATKDAVESYRVGDVALD